MDTSSIGERVDVTGMAHDLARSKSSFVLRAKGDGMRPDGIHNGDYLIVREQSECKNGDMVIVQRGKVARLYRIYAGEPGYVRFVNLAGQSLTRPAARTRPSAVVLAMIRKY